MPKVLSMERQLKRAIFLPVCPEIAPEKFRDGDPQNVWCALKRYNQQGFITIFYPEKNQSDNQGEIGKVLSLAKKENLTSYAIPGNERDDFLKAIEDYNVNPANSVFVGKDPGIIRALTSKYLPKNFYNKDSDIIHKPLGFYFVNWNPEIFREETYILPGTLKKDYAASLSLPEDFFSRLTSAFYSPFFDDKIVFIDDWYESTASDYFQNNLNNVKQLAHDKGYSLIYPPFFLDQLKQSGAVIEYIKLMHPDARILNEANSERIFSGVIPNNFTDEFLRLLNLPEFRVPALLRIIEPVTQGNPHEYTVFLLDEDKNVESQIESYFFSLNPHYKLSRSLSETLSPLSQSKPAFDDTFRAFTINGLFANLAVNVLERTRGELLKPWEITGPGETDPAKLTSRSSLKIEWTSKFNFDILLPDFDNMVIDMPRLPKALYFLFLKHPEGIMLNCIADYQKELHDIYARISNISEKDEIDKNVNRIIDPFDNSLNVNLSRIKSAFVKKLGDEIAENYYVTGQRGAEKKIHLSQHLIHIIE